MLLLANVKRRAAAGLSLALLLMLSACATPGGGSKSPALSRYEYAQPEMGVPFCIVLYAPDEARAQAAASAAYHRIRDLNDILSDYDTDSELNRLCQTAGKKEAVRVSEDLWQVLSRAQALAERTGGAFDVTVRPCSSLWRRSRRLKQMPNPESLAAARAAVGYQKVRLDARNRTVGLLAPNMRLDLGGIAKGYALDEALAVLRSHRIRRALVSGGGDMALGDPPPGREGWRIEIAPLDAPQAPPSRFAVLNNVGLATSGDVFQHVVIEGKRYSHIVDPRTGIGLTDHSLVTVIARDATTADGLATAASVLGPQAGLKLIDATPGAAAYIVRQPADSVEQYESRRLTDYCESP